MSDSQSRRASAGIHAVGIKSLVAVLSFGCLSTIHAQEWTPLFNGKNLEHWAHVGEGGFEIEDGLLKTRGGMGLLWSTLQKFENVRLRIVYKGAAQSNSGIFIRIPERPTEPWMPVNRGYEVQIDDTEDDYHVTGVLYSLTKAMAAPPSQDSWNEMLITLEGDRTLVEVNGTLITDFREGDWVRDKVHDYEPDRGPRPIAGYIGLQNHGDRDTVYFKEISFQRLSQ